ncbi:hypothetical protein AAG906_037020 [Vitis piasezkii]
MIPALNIGTTLEQHPLIWFAVKLHIMLTSFFQCLLQLITAKRYLSQIFSVELDGANVTWLSNDMAMLYTKTGELLLLTLTRSFKVLGISVYFGIAAIGSSLSFLGSQLGDSLLVQFTSIPSSSVEKKVGDIEGDVPSAKRSCRSSSDALQDMVDGDKLPLYGSAPNSTETSQKTFSFSVTDSLINVGPLKDFAYGLRINADQKATGIVKQSNFELMCCSGHGKNGALCILQQSIRPEMITELRHVKIKEPSKSEIGFDFDKSSQNAELHSVYSVLNLMKMGRTSSDSDGPNQILLPPLRSLIMLQCIWERRKMP